MKRKRKLIPLELQKRYDKLLAVVPELSTVQDVQQSLDIIKGCTNAEGFNALGYALTNVFESAWLKDAKMIYEFDKTLFETLSGQTDLSVASDTLKRLPFRCAYVSMPIKLTGPQGTPMDGFFVLKKEDVIKCLFVSTDTMAFGQLDIHLSAKTFEESENLSVKEAQRYGTEFARSPNSVTTKTSKLITQLLLYLCASNADVQERRPTTVNKKTPKAADKRPVRCWDVGVRVGATIKRNRSYAAQTQHKGNDHKQHARPRPHLRRGHWSHFWTGKRDSADRERILKWIEPVYINANTPDDLPTTIHRVKQGEITMKKTSEAQIKAVKAYKKRNPALTYYQARWSNARAFVSSKADRFEEAKQAAGISRYREDLENLRDMIEEKLNEM